MATQRLWCAACRRLLTSVTRECLLFPPLSIHLFGPSKSSSRLGRHDFFLPKSGCLSTGGGVLLKCSIILPLEVLLTCLVWKQNLGPISQKPPWGPLFFSTEVSLKQRFKCSPALPNYQSAHLCEERHAGKIKIKCTVCFACHCLEI